MKTVKRTTWCVSLAEITALSFLAALAAAPAAKATTGDVTVEVVLPEETPAPAAEALEPFEGSGVHRQAAAPPEDLMASPAAAPALAAPATPSFSGGCSASDGGGSPLGWMLPALALVLALSTLRIGARRPD